MQHWQLGVPFDQPLRLWLFSRYLGIRDANGKVLDHLGTEVPFDVPSGTVPTSFDFTIIRLD
jgi:hypothetical protein